MNSHNHLILFCGTIAASQHAASFSNPSFQRLPTFRGVASAKSSLKSAANGMFEQPDHLSANNNAASDYLNSLSNIVGGSSSTSLDPANVSPEEFLSALSSQILEASRTMSPNSFESGELYLADGNVLGGGVVNVANSWYAQGEGGGGYYGSDESFMSYANSVSSPVDFGAAGDSLQYSVSDVANSVAGQSKEAAKGIVETLAVSASKIDPSSTSSEGSASGVQETVNDITDSLSSQLSDLSYNSLVFKEKAKAAPPLPNVREVRESISSQFSAMTDSLAEKYSSFASHPTTSFNEAFSSAKDAGISTLQNLAHDLPGKVAHAGSSSVKFLGKTIDSVSVMARKASLSDIAAGSVVNVQSIGDKTLVDVADGVVAGIAFMGGILVQLLDVVLGPVAGTNVASVVQSSRESISSVVDGATNYVVTTVHNIGSMTIAEFLQAMVSLVIAISSISFMVVDAVVKLLSGREASEWAMAVSSALDHNSKVLLAQASAAADDITHTSLSELASSIGDFSQHVGNDLVAMFGSLNEAVVTGDGSSLGDYVGSIVTALQSSFSI